ncbi:hypothetical protein E4T38_03950 [Aureobasidium subglaciale]|nr:hypothetical protein E4T38_03950 [Aureobasidium subglaciale]KAI5225167.1 hypothetical protein E4T40_03725 [Aureobasidium subglaciale]KAI5228771.1 hypothetical protein E4T41_03790 [Aureobasidium subglaciale]KAI5263632.1 hypothetical protein E4T46_03566 [Aureobasidium subglaciale]
MFNSGRWSSGYSVVGGTIVLVGSVGSRKLSGRTAPQRTHHAGRYRVTCHRSIAEGWAREFRGLASSDLASYESSSGIVLVSQGAICFCYPSSLSFRSLLQHRRQPRRSVVLSSHFTARDLPSKFDMLPQFFILETKVFTVKEPIRISLRSSIFILATRDLENSAILHFQHGNRTLESQWVSSGIFLNSVQLIDNEFAGLG